MRKILCLLIIIGLGSTLPVAAAASAPANEIPPDKVIRKDPGDNPVENQWIVVLGEKEDPDEFSREVGGEVVAVLRDALVGLVVQVDDAEAERLAADGRVQFVEQDHEVTTQEVQQSGATWGLDRVDQRFLALDGSYWYYTDAGNVHAYVLDTGIYAPHNDFEGRVDTSPGGGFTVIIDGNGTNDCHGHGTHVAGTLGGETWGVAKEVTLHPVRVLNCFGFGSWAGVIQGIDWVTANHVKPAVANMSLGGGFNLAANTAVNNSVARGVFYAVAAGNSNSDACNFSPASAASAFTVGSTTITDQRSSFSNFGPCLDGFAPGSSITSAWIGSPTATNTISGTSMASPHVAGAAALYLAEYPWALPADTTEAIQDAATANVVINPGAGSPNLLLYSRLGSRATAFKGSLTTLWQENIHPLGTFYFGRVAGAHEARLDGPAGANFDLALFKWNPGTLTWVQVASSTGPSADEHVIHHDTEGLFYWRVINAGGSGVYVLETSQP